jgi:hypothetical protein
MSCKMGVADGERNKKPHREVGFLCFYGCVYNLLIHTPTIATLPSVILCGIVIGLCFG